MAILGTMLLAVVWFFGVIFALGIIGLISLMLMPGFFTCFAVIIAGIVLLLIVTLSVLPLGPILLFLLICYCILVAVRYWNYKQLSSYDAYLTNVSARSSDGKLSCVYCGSDRVTSVGLFMPTGKLRYCLCLNCRHKLYRFKVI